MPFNKDDTQIKVLIVLANPRGTDPLQLGTEDRTIRESVRLSPYRDKISLTVCHAATIHDLRRSLLSEEFQIVHISGHGTGDGLILEGEFGGEQRIPQTALAELFQAYSPSIQCVILNACYSTSQGRLMSQGVPFTIAMEGPIGDQAAIEFSRGFYDAIGAGRTIDFAYEEGVRTVRLTVPDALFISQILVRDNKLRFFLLKEEEPLPVGYACISLHRGKVAIKPLMYQSLQALIDDLYLSYLGSQYEPYTYGAAWMLVSSATSHFWGYQRLVAPWSWLLPDNKGKSISRFNPDWDISSPEAYGIKAGTYWTVINPSETQVVGLATNSELIAKCVDSISKKYQEQENKRLWLIMSDTRGEIGISFVNEPSYLKCKTKLVSVATLNSGDYNFLFVFTGGLGYGYEAKIGRAVVAELIDGE